MFSLHLEEPSLGALLVPQVKLTAAHIIEAGEQARIPIPQDLCLLDNHSCSWLSSHYLRHNESLLEKQKYNNK